MLKMSSPHIRGYSRESVIAEKLQALVYLGLINSRMKDFYDLWVLAQIFEFDGTVLQEAVRQTFRHRETAIPVEIPAGLSKQFASEKRPQWLAFLNRTRIDMSNVSFEDVVQTLDGFLLPVLSASAQDMNFKGYWKPGGGWKIPGQF